MADDGCRAEDAVEGHAEGAGKGGREQGRLVLSGRCWRG